ncbi:hypothetical protein F4604DRAFT_1680991 [Suillus subluteus]|nr:hypothetical protein F4604DRAFT_1680991 [Suillus subluteus]
MNFSPSTPRMPMPKKIEFATVLSCMANIRTGEPCFYVATIEPGQRGRYVCESCHLHYENKRSYFSETYSRTLQSQGRAPPNPRTIQQLVNAAQRRSTPNPPPVVAIPGGSCARGPDIRIPTSWQGAIGYSSQHALYAAEHDRWGKMAYASSLAETILLEITMVHEGARARKKRGIAIGNICEGKKDVDARIDASGLIKLALETVVTKLRKLMENLSGMLRIVPEAQWNEYENWLELRAEMLKLSERAALSLAEHATAHTAIGFNVPSSAERATAHTAIGFNVPSSATTSLTENELFLPSCDHQQFCDGLYQESPPAVPKALAVSVKNPPPAAFHSPDRDLLKEVLKIGRGANLNVKQVFGLHSESVQFHQIPTRDITDLLLHKQHHSFSVDTAESSIGQLTIDTSTDWLHWNWWLQDCERWMAHTHGSSQDWSRIRWLVIRSWSNWPFEKVFPTAMKVGAYKVGRYSLTDELWKLFREANVLYWSKSLLKLTYDFIDRSIASSPEPPPFTGGSKPGAKTGSTRAVFLLEELIEGGDDMFVKFIHNMDANPLLDELDYGYDIAEFFVFTQHVQYVKTGKLAFISDYQGSTVLLTDPQILTHHIGRSAMDVIFLAREILRHPVSKFEDQHACNEYCGWFGLETFVKEANDDGVVVEG